MHTSEPNEVTEMEVISTVSIPSITSLVNPFDQRKSTGIGTRIHVRAIGSTRVGHARHARIHMGTKGPRNEITQGIITRHEGEGRSKRWGWEPYLTPPSFLSPSSMLVRLLCHWSPFQAFLLLVAVSPLPIICTLLHHLVVML